MNFFLDKKDTACIEVLRHPKSIKLLSKSTKMDENSYVHHSHGFITIGNRLHQLLTFGYIRNMGVNPNDIGLIIWKYVGNECIFEITNVSNPTTLCAKFTKFSKKAIQNFGISFEVVSGISGNYQIQCGIFLVNRLQTVSFSEKKQFIIDLESKLHQLMQYNTFRSIAESYLFKSHQIGYYGLSFEKDKTILFTSNQNNTFCDNPTVNASHCISVRITNDKEILNGINSAICQNRANEYCLFWTVKHGNKREQLITNKNRDQLIQPISHFKSYHCYFAVSMKNLNTNCAQFSFAMADPLQPIDMMSNERVAQG